MKIDPLPEPARQEEERRTGVLDLIRQNRPELLLGLARMVTREILNTPTLAWRRWQIRSCTQRAIGYIGFIGHANLGDEAVFQAIRESLIVDESLIPFIAAEGESMLARLGLGGTAIFRAVLLGGGTLIHPYYSPVARKAREVRHSPVHGRNGCRREPWILYSGASPPLHGWKETSPGLSASVRARGPRSCELLQNLGLVHAEVIGDPALGLASDIPQQYRSRQRLIINLAQESPPASESGEYAMYRQVARIANDFADQGGEVVGTALGPGDRAALEMLKRDHHLVRLRIEDHRTSTDGLFETISGSIGLIGVRLHSAVLASCVGVPSILFSYRDKCKDFMTSMDLGDFAVEISRDHGPRRIEQCFDRLQSDGDLGPAIYKKAVFWKRQQHAFYARLARAISAI